MREVKLLLRSGIRETKYEVFESGSERLQTRDRKVRVKVQPCEKQKHKHTLQLLAVMVHAGP